MRFYISLKPLIYLVLLINVFLLTACGGGGSGSTDGSAVTNRAPVANVVSIGSTNGGETVMLDATGSSDPDGDQLVYTWLQTQGSTVDLNDIHSSRPSFVAPLSDETLTFNVTVSDGEATSGPASVSVTILAYTGTRVSWEQNPMIEYLSLPGISETVVVGNFAYTTNGFDGLKIFDVSDPKNISLVGEYSELGAGFSQIAVSGNIAIIGGGSYPAEVRIIDISTPSSPVLLSSAQTTIASDIFIQGNTVYITTDYPNDFDFMDITDPANPVDIVVDAGFFLPYTANTIYMQGTTGYVTTTNGGPMHILDLSDPTLPVLLGSTEELIQATSVVVSGNYAYLTDAVFGLRIYDISTPATPTKVGEIALEGATWSVTLDGSKAYVATGPSGLSIVDVTDVTTPTLIAVYDTPGLVYNSTVLSNIAYVWDIYVGLQVIDVSNPSLASPIRTVGSSVRGEAVEVESGKAYLADSDSDNGGLKIFDVSNPLAPVLSGVYSQAYGNPSDVTLVGNNAYISRRTSGFQSVDISTPTAVSMIAEVDAVGFTSTESVAVEGDYAYVVTRSEGRLQIYDLSDPLSPTLSSSLTLNTFVDAFSVQIRNNRAYIASNDGLVIVDVSDPTAPVILGSDTAIALEYATDIKVMGELAFVSQPGNIHNPQGGIFIFDVSIPSVPVLLSNYDGDSARVSSYSSIDLAGDSIYASQYSASAPEIMPGILILDAADPTNPTLMGKFRASDRANDITVNGDYFYVATETDGLSVMQRAPDLSPRYSQASVTEVLSYTVSWSEFPGTDTIELVCETSGGACTVDTVDQLSKSATVSWKLPDTAGDYEVLIAVGDQHSFYSARDRVRVQ